MVNPRQCLPLKAWVGVGLKPPSPPPSPFLPATPKMSNLLVEYLPLFIYIVPVFALFRSNPSQSLYLSP